MDIVIQTFVAVGNLMTIMQIQLPTPILPINGIALIESFVFGAIVIALPNILFYANRSKKKESKKQ